MFNPMTIMQLAPQIALLAGELTGKEKEAGMLAGILGITGQITEALKSPNIGTGLGIADSKSSEAFKKNPEGIFGGGLKEGATFGEGMEINKLPESIGGDFKSPSWNAPESIFKPPGETKPFDSFDWSLFR
jgi:hypothetical protein